MRTLGIECIDKSSLIFKLVLVLSFLVFGFVYLPIPSLEIDQLESFELTEAHFSLIEASHNLHRPFPDMITRSDNPTTPEKAELGRLLCFDSILSGDNDISYAHCHHPDLVFPIIVLCLWEKAETDSADPGKAEPPSDGGSHYLECGL